MRKAILSSKKAPLKTRSDLLAPSRTSQSDESGWALLGIVLALAIMGIMLAALAPNVSFQVRRDKEAEMLYRGEEMAKAIARYYNNGRLGPVNVANCPQPRGCLLDILKLKEPYLVGVNEIKLVRLSATTDPMTNSDWEPVRLRDPRLQAVLQAYASATGLQIPELYERMAGPPPPLITNPVDDTDQQPPSQQTPSGDQQRNNPGVVANPDVQAPPDPFAHFFADGNSGPGLSNVPIIGVAPKIKGQAVRTLYGLQNYEEWVFIYIPPLVIQTGGQFNQNPPPGNTPPGGTPPGGAPPGSKVSQ